MYVFQREARPMGFSARITHAKAEKMQLSTKVEIAMEKKDRREGYFPLVSFFIRENTDMSVS
jgi:hypothetical protein